MNALYSVMLLRLYTNCFLCLEHAPPFSAWQIPTDSVILYSTAQIPVSLVCLSWFPEVELTVPSPADSRPPLWQVLTPLG